MNLLSSWRFIPRIFTGSLKYLQNSQIISEVNLTSLSEPYSARSYFNVHLFYLGLLSRETAFHNTEGKWKKLLFPTTTSTFPWKFRNLFAVMLLRCLPQLSTAVRVISGLFLSKINNFWITIWMKFNCILIIDFVLDINFQLTNAGFELPLTLVLKT